MMQAMQNNFKSIDPVREIEGQAKRIELIRQCANEAKAVYFDQKWMAVLIRCAEWHASQPLGPDVYREPGGALRWTIELAFYSMRLAGGQKFAANLTSEERRRVEPQYNYGVFLAAVCSGLDEPHRHFRAFRIRDDAEWNPPAHGALNPWLGGSEFRLERRGAPLAVERMRTSMLAQLIVGPQLLSTLDAEVLSQTFGAINPAPTPMQGETVTHKVLREAVKVAIDFDLKAQRTKVVPVEYAIPPVADVSNAVAPTPEPTPGAAVTPDSAAMATPASREPQPSAGAAPLPPPVNVATASGTGGKPVDPRQISLLDPVADEQIPAAAGSVEPPVPTLNEGLKGYPPMIVDFFKALKQDVESGKAKVTWGRMGLSIPKKLLGGYGIASDSLIDVLRKKGVLLENSRTDITIAQSIGRLVKAREEVSA
jgi:conjugal transfer pilus assembly protein TraI